MSEGADTALMEHNRNMEALFKISCSLAQCLGRPELMDRTLLEILKTTEIAAVGIFLLDEKKNHFILSTSKGTKGEFAGWVESMPATEAFSMQMALQGETLLVRDATLEPNLVRMGLNQEGLRSLAAIPMKAKGKVIGMICAASLGSREFNEQDMRLFTIISNQIAVAIEYGQLSELTAQNAHVDDLTGLYNKRYLEAEIDRMFACATGSEHRPMSIIKMAVDRLSELNDSPRRQEGDAVLKELAKIIKLQIRGYDIAARWGGDVFILLLPETGSEHALKIGKRINSEVKKCRAVTDGMEMAVSLSMGIASYPIHARDATELLKAADKALSVAKRAGGDKIFSATPLVCLEDGALASVRSSDGFQ